MNELNVINRSKTGNSSDTFFIVKLCVFVCDEEIVVYVSHKPQDYDTFNGVFTDYRFQCVHCVQ